MSRTAPNNSSKSVYKKTNGHRILVIDDNPQIHEDFRKILVKEKADATLEELDALVFGKQKPKEAGVPDFSLDYANQGEQGLRKVCESIEQSDPYAMAFVDVRMPPGWDGVETVSKIMTVDSKIQIVFCTAYSDYAMEDILDRFGLSDRVMILQKPFDPVEVQSLAVAMTQKWSRNIELARIGMTQSQTLQRATSLLDEMQKANESLLNEKQSYTEDAEKLATALQETTSRIATAEDAMLLAIATVVEKRDAGLGDHLKRMQQSAQIIAERLSQHGPYQEQIDERFLQSFYRSTPLHDLGKVGIPDGILLKAGPLTDAEFEIMKQHPVIGHQIICETMQGAPVFDFMNMAADVTRHHHESWDGKGYPDQLAGEEIPLAARIAAVADAFDAMTSQRVYSDAITDFEARCRIEKASGTQFDPTVVEAFSAKFSEICEAKRKFEKSNLESVG